jgi:integrase
MVVQKVAYLVAYQTTFAMIKLTATKWPGLQKSQTGIYYARISTDGKRVCRSLGTTDLPVAKMKLEDLRARLGKVNGTEPVHWGRAVDWWLQEIEARRDCKASTIRFYRESVYPTLKGFFPVNDSAGRISADRVRDTWQKFARKSSATPANCCLSALKAIGERVGWPVEWSRGLKRVRATTKALRLPDAATMLLLIEEIRAQKKANSNEAADMVHWMMLSGLRVSEAAGLRWEDVSATAMVVRAGKTAAAARRVPILPDLLPLVESRRKRTGRVFTLMTPREALRGACRRLGIDRLCPHDLRHWFATRCLECGIDPPTVAAWLGHADKGATVMKVYGHVRVAHSDAAAQLVRL